MATSKFIIKINMYFYHYEKSILFRQYLNVRKSNLFVKIKKSLVHHIYYYRDNGVKAIENLMTKKGKFDYVLLETTGLADPGNNV
jgi:hypothetical protein